MPKTVVVNYFGRHGSGPEYSFEMTRGLVESGCRVHAIVSDSIDNIDRWRALPLASLTEVPTSERYQGAVSSTLRFLTRGLKSLRRRFKSEDVDMLYIPMLHPLNVPVLRMFRRMGVKTVFTMHDVWPHRGETNLAYLPIRLSARYLARNCDRMVILSERFREYVCQTYGHKPEDVVVAPHGVFYTHTPEAAVPVAPLAEFNFLFFGRIVEYKGLDILAEAYRRVAEARPGRVSLRIVGSGDFSPYAPMYEGLPGVVVDNRFVDAKDVSALFDMPQTITVLPYIEASQSGIIPIAMAKESGIVVTNLQGLMEQTQDGRLALTCRPDAESLARAMLRYIDDYDQLAQMRTDARLYIESLDWTRIASNMVGSL